MNSGLYGLPGAVFDVPADEDTTDRLLTWWDFSDASARTDVSGKVSVMANKAGRSAIDLTQVTAGNRPTVTAAALNGRDVATFAAGSSTFMQSSVNLAVDRFTIFAVMKCTNTAIFMEHSANANSNDGCYFYTDVSFSSLVRRSGVNTTVDIGSGWLQGNTWRIIAMRNSSDGMSIWRNGSLIGSSTAPASLVANAVLYLCSRGGGSLYMSGAVGEIKVFDSDISPSAMLAQFAILNSRWAVY